MPLEAKCFTVYYAIEDTIMSIERLMPHQADHVPWLLERPRAMLAWEMGVGKTAPLLRAWENSRKLGTALVLCPATARVNWLREIAKMAINPEHPPRAHIVGMPKTSVKPPDIFIMNYEKMLLPRFRQFASSPWGALILDEAHRLKTSTAKTTGYVYGFHSNERPLISYAKRVWLATGTPMPNHPGELFAPMRALWPQALWYKNHIMEEWEFEAAFCRIKETKYGKVVVGGQNLDELKGRIRPYLSRLLRENVLDLPPLMIRTWPLDMTVSISDYDAPELLPDYDAPELLRSLTGRFGPIGQIDHFDEAKLDDYLHAIEDEQLPTLRRKTGNLKATAVGHLIKDEIEDGAGKMVVYAHHHEALTILHNALRRHNPAVIHGGVPMGKRQAEIDRFQTDPRCKILIGGLTVAGIAINLTAATEVIFVETSWVPGENDQAISRVYRNGQTQKVRVRFVFLPNSLDEAINVAIARKMAMISHVIGG